MQIQDACRTTRKVRASQMEVCHLYKLITVSTTSANNDSFSAT